MDAGAVVHNLRHKNIIGGGDLNNITQNSDPDQKNQILHLALMQKCTNKALMEACDIIIAVSNPKMAALGEAMKRELVASKCYVCVVYSACLYVSCVHVICWLHVCLCMYVCPYVRVCVHAC